jgi:hypothetical protein
MILSERLGELLAGLTDDQEALLEEILGSPYFRKDPGVLRRILWASRPAVNRLMEVLDRMNEYPGVDPGDLEITVRPRDESA